MKSQDGSPRRFPMRGGLGVLWAALLVACGQAPAKRPDLLLVSVDTLRADFLGSYGNPSGSTPALDRLSAAGVVFERHYSASSQTAPSHASLLSGLHPSEHGLGKNGMALDPDVPYLPELLRGEGYATLGVTAFRILSADFGFERGFAVLDANLKSDPGAGEQRGPAREHSRVGSRVVDLALQYLDAQDLDQPLFLFVHLFDPHAPYAPPTALGFDVERSLAAVETRGIQSERFAARQLRSVQVAYDSEVAYVDGQVQRLLSAWDERRAPRDSIVAFTSDHGESLGEHAFIGHGLLLTDPLLRVPLLVRATGRLDPGRISYPTSAVGLPAMLLDLCGLAWPDGRRGLLQDSAAPLYASRPVYSEFDLSKPGRNEVLEHHAGTPFGSRGSVRAVVEWPYKLIETSDAGSLLFDLEADPTERVDLSAADPANLQRLAALLQQFDATHTTRASAPEVADPTVREMLDALGY